MSPAPKGYQIIGNPVSFLVFGSFLVCTYASLYVSIFWLLLWCLYWTIGYLLIEPSVAIWDRRFGSRRRRRRSLFRKELPDLVFLGWPIVAPLVFGIVWGQLLMDRLFTEGTPR